MDTTGVDTTGAGATGAGGSRDAVEALRAALPDGVLVTDPDVVEPYRWDWSRDVSAGQPRAVVRAVSAEDVQVAVR